MTYTGIFSGLKWRNPKQKLIIVCLHNNLVMEYLEEKNSFFKTFVTFEVSGSEEDINNFEYEMKNLK